MRQSAVSFNVKDLSFEGVVAQPDEHNGSMPGVVICHPHPLYGGNMDNHVVLTLGFALAEAVKCMPTRVRARNKQRNKRFIG